MNDLETPPQMRGTQRLECALRDGFGNTPADAGNSFTLATSRRFKGKHPRRCGELGVKPLRTFAGRETPPQMRGTPEAVSEQAGRRRNTPADAGNSLCSAEDPSLARKHPRRCGELRGVVSDHALQVETPPQMRGTLVDPQVALTRAGNTPADAGNSERRRSDDTAIQKHPRRCGELARNTQTVRLLSETPPQMRGTPSGRRFEVEDLRNTPADAGNSYGPEGRE